MKPTADDDDNNDEYLLPSPPSTYKATVPESELVVGYTFSVRYFGCVISGEMCLLCTHVFCKIDFSDQSFVNWVRRRDSSRVKVSNS